MKKNLHSPISLEPGERFSYDLSDKYAARSTVQSVLLFSNKYK